MAEVAERMPDEFHAWLRETVARFRSDYAIVDFEVRSEFAVVRERVGAKADRKAFAQAVVESRNKAFLFKLLDGAPIAEMIWKQLRPENVRPFREQNEAVA